MNRKYFILILLVSSSFGLDKYYVNNIIFSGNHALSNTEITKILRLSNQSYFSATVYSDKKRKLDEISISALYKSKGFLKVIVVSSYQMTDNQVDIYFDVNEGSRFKLSSKVFKGNRILSDSFISNYIDIKIDDYLNIKKLKHKLKSLRGEYLKIGRVNIDIIDEIIYNSNGTVSLRISISEGNIFYIEDIKIEGSTNVNINFIMNQLIFNSNTPYNQELINRSIINLLDTQLFSSVDIYPVIASEKNIDIIVKIKEQTSSIDAEIGLSRLPSETGLDSRAGFEAKVLWNIRNIFSYHKNITVQGNIGLNYFDNLNNNLYTYNRVEISYFGSKIFFLNIPHRIVMYNENIRQIGFKQTQGFRLSTTKSYSGGNYSSGLVFEFINSDFNITPEEERRSIYLIINKYNVQNLLLPKQGYVIGLKSEIFGTFLGGKQNYSKNDIEFKYYYPITSDIIVANRIKYGLILETNSLSTLSNIPNDSYFYLGGTSTLRGWLDPYDYNDYAGGLERVVINNEIRINAFELLGFSVFSDTGKLLNIDNKIQLNIGWGVYYITPLGPARIDFAYRYNVNKLSKPTIQFSLLNMF